MDGNQHLTKATEDIAVSVVDFRYTGMRDRSPVIAESAVILNFDTPEERIVGIQVHGRWDGRRNRTNRAIAQRIARQIRKREAAKSQA